MSSRKRLSRTAWVERLLDDRGPMTSQAVGVALRKAGKVTPEQCAEHARKTKARTTWSSTEHLVATGATHIAAYTLKTLVDRGHAKRCGWNGTGKLLTGPISLADEEGGK